MSEVDNQPDEPRKFTEAIKSTDYPQAGTFKEDLNPQVKDNVPVVNADISPTTQKLLNGLSELQAQDMEKYGMANSIQLYGTEYQRNPINIRLRKKLAKLSTTLEMARTTPMFQEVELKTLEQKFELIWNLKIMDEMDSELLFRIMAATEIAINYKFR